MSPEPISISIMSEKTNAEMKPPPPVDEVVVEDAKASAKASVSAQDNTDDLTLASNAESKQGIVSLDSQSQTTGKSKFLGLFNYMSIQQHKEEFEKLEKSQQEIIKNQDRMHLDNIRLKVGQKRTEEKLDELLSQQEDLKDAILDTPAKVKEGLADAMREVLAEFGTPMKQTPRRRAAAAAAPGTAPRTARQSEKRCRPPLSVAASSKKSKKVRGFDDHVSRVRHSGIE